MDYCRRHINIFLVSHDGCALKLLSNGCMYSSRELRNPDNLLMQNIYFPALNPIATDLGVSVSLINLTLTTYMVFQGIAPTIFGDFGDVAGRRPAFILAVVIYIFGSFFSIPSHSFPP